MSFLGPQELWRVAPSLPVEGIFDVFNRRAGNNVIRVNAAGIVTSMPSVTIWGKLTAVLDFP